MGMYRQVGGMGNRPWVCTDRWGGGWVRDHGSLKTSGGGWARDHGSLKTDGGEGWVRDHRSV